MPPKAKTPLHHYHAHVVELSSDVLYEHKFKKANAGYVTSKPFVYVGMAGLDPATRFDKHKADIKAKRYAKEYGLRRLPSRYEVYNPLLYVGARDMEVDLAISLHEAGYGASCCHCISSEVHDGPRGD